MTTQLLDTEIVYDRTTRDYSVLICDQIVASAPNYRDAEAKRTQLLSERLADGLYATASELDGGAADPPTEPNDTGAPIGPDTTRLIPCHSLHVLAQTDPAEFRAKLAALSEADLATQAQLYALYAAIACGREISADETLEHFRLSVEVHRAAVRSEDRVCEVLFELALTDAPAMIEFLRGHTDQQREQLAWRYAAWLRETCEITREPAHILKGWQTLIVGAAASGAERLQIELADCLGFAEGWDVVAALWAGADASAESYAAL